MGKKCCCNTQKIRVAKRFLPPDGTVTIINQDDGTFTLSQGDFKNNEIFFQVLLTITYYHKSGNG